MKKGLILSFLIGSIFLGCATKIDINQYRPKSVLTDENAPKKLKNIEHKAAIVRFDKKFFNGIDVSSIAQSQFIFVLQQSGLINELKLINKNQINDYVKLAEIEKSNDNSNVLYHLIKGEVVSVKITDNGTYHPPKYDKKGRKISEGCYSYEVCANVKADVFLLPSKDLEADRIREDCEDTCIKSNNYSIVNKLALSAVKYSAGNVASSLKSVFTPQGYVYEYRENKDHDLIAHITLGTKNGLKQNITIYFYKVEKDSMGKKTLIKVGEGKVSQLIGPDNAWVVVEFKKGYQPKIGYVVKPDVSDSFIDRLKRKLFE